MAHRAIEQGNCLQAQLLRLIHDECSARNKRRPVLQGGFTGHRFPGQTHITGERKSRERLSAARYGRHALPCHQG